MHLVCTCTFSLSFIIDCYSLLLERAASLMGQCALLVALQWTISIMFIVFLVTLVENKLSLSLSLSLSVYRHFRIVALRSVYDKRLCASYFILIIFFLLIQTRG